MFKTNLTESLYSTFIESFESFQVNSSSNSPFVYVDQNHCKVLTSLSGSQLTSDVFAISIAQDGLIEYLTIK